MIIPAIDLVDGQVVRLKQGDFNQKTVFNYDPLSRIKIAAQDGAELMHLVDLDGAKDPNKRQLELIGNLVKKSPIPIQTGGGIRSENDVKALLDLGVLRVVIGSFAVYQKDVVAALISKYGADHITLAFDVKIVDGKALIATHGWQEVSSITIEDLIKFYQSVNLKHVLVTDISKDGMMQGANYQLYHDLHEKFNELDIIASGGISSLDDIAKTAKSGASSVVLGRALLEDKFTVKEAIACWQNA